RPRHSFFFSKCNRGGAISDQSIWSSRQGDGNRSDQYQWGLRSWQYSFCASLGKLCQSAKKCAFALRPGILALCSVCCNQEIITGTFQGRDYPGCGNGGVREEKKLALHPGKVRVYDIRNAGRRHRFTVSGKLVHNCGYQGGTGALISMGALSMGLREEELPDIIEQWRAASPHIVQFWWDMEKAATETVKTHEEHMAGRIRFQYYGGTLWMVLPSGRKLAYLKPKLQPNRFGRMSLTFEGVGNAAGSGGWSRQETYGGKLSENCTQATARDILTEAMWRLEQAGFAVIAHVHDEVIIEAPIGKYPVDEVCKRMAENPDWCPDCPLAAAGYLAPNYYFKD